MAILRAPRWQAVDSAVASATDCSGVSSPRAARANMLGMMGRPKTSPSAVFAGPGCPMFVAQSVEVVRIESLSAGSEPKGSSSNQSLSLGTKPSHAGKSYSFE